MIHEALSSWIKKDPIVHSLFLFFGSILFLGLGFIVFLVFKFFVWDRIAERIIDQKFHSEIISLPVKVTNFNLWEGDSMVSLDIFGKGPVSFWYGIDGLPRIETIGSYVIPFTCFKVDSQGQRIDYAYNTGLYLDDSSTYKKWFDFKVKNLNDLVNKYDLIVSVLDKFPKNPAMIDFVGNNNLNKYPMVKNPDPNFVLIQKNSDQTYSCDLYVTTSTF